MSNDEKSDKTKNIILIFKIKSYEDNDGFG